MYAPLNFDIISGYNLRTKEEKAKFWGLTSEECVSRTELSLMR